MELKPDKGVRVGAEVVLDLCVCEEVSIDYLRKIRKHADQLGYVDAACLRPCFHRAQRLPNQIVELATYQSQTKDLRWLEHFIEDCQCVAYLASCLTIAKENRPTEAY